jgi:uncharacterized protein (TIGR03437 family)
MGPKQFDLNQRLDAYFATLRPAALKDALKRSAGNWQLYAAVTSSAMAMATGASAQAIAASAADVAADPVESARTAGLLIENSKSLPLMNAVRQAMARASRHITVGVGQVQTPAISSIVPLDGTQAVIQPGEWISIFGTNLAAEPMAWKGDFPTSLGGTSVEIDGRPAFLQFVSSGQINAQAPDDTTRGLVSVVVTTGGVKATSYVTLSDFAPAFTLLDTKHVSAIILRRNHSGAFGGGTYDILGPTGNSFGYPTVAARAGDKVELFAVGLGPTTPAVAAGAPFSGAAPIKSKISLTINNLEVKPHFVGLSSAGVYQINFRVPFGLGEGDVPIRAVVGSMQTQPGAVFSLQSGSFASTNPVTVGGGFSTGLHFFSTVVGTGGTMGGTGGGTGGGGGNGGGGGTGGGAGTGGGNGGGTGGGGGGTGGGGGGTGGGSMFKPHQKPYHPKLTFPPK